MSKKRPPADTVVLYVELPPTLKRRLGRLARLHLRKLSAEAIMALTLYIEGQEEKEGLTDVPLTDDD